MKKFFINDEAEIFAIHDISQDITYPFSLMIVSDEDYQLGEFYTKTYEDMINTLRFLRDEKISKTDWILSADLYLINKLDIIKYRDELRDITNLYPNLESFEKGIIFPLEVIPEFRAMTDEEKVFISTGIAELTPVTTHPSKDVLPGKMFIYNFGDYLYLRYADGTYIKIK